MDRRLKIGIVGCGRVGRAFAIALSNAGYPIAFMVDDNRKLLFTLQRLFPNTRVIPEYRNWPAFDVLLIAVNDDAIGQVAETIADAGQNVSRKVIAHASGALTSEVLAPLQEKGAFVASIHPVQTFSGAQKDAKKMQDCFFALEGDPRALQTLKGMVETMGARWFELKPEQKSLHHLACVLVSNYIVTLINVAVELLQSVGLDEDDAKRVLSPLIQASIDNVANQSLSAALTGPISRGDANTVERHLNLIRRDHPDLLPLYVEMARKTVELAQKQPGRSEADLLKIRQLLEDALPRAGT